MVTQERVGIVSEGSSSINSSQLVSDSLRHYRVVTQKCQIIKQGFVSSCRKQLK